MRYSENVELAKREINQDIQNGIVPSNVDNFSALHDYVDANEYGECCGQLSEQLARQGEWLEAVNEIQNELNEWLQKGRP